MSVTILTISSYIYLITTLLLPQQMMLLTSQFLSYITTITTIALPNNEESSFINLMLHVSKCLLLSLRFIVLCTILSGKALYTLFANEKITSLSSSSLPLPLSTMQPNASLTLESTTQNGTEPITVSPVSSSKIKPAKLEKQTISSVVPILDGDKTIIINNQENTPPVSSVASIILGDQVIMKQENLLSDVTPIEKEPDASFSSSLSVNDRIPSLQSDDSSSIKQSSDVSKEQCYMEETKKENNLMSSSLSDNNKNTQHLFNELTSTPVLYHHHQHERTSSAQQSIEEIVPDLSPHPSSSVSRKSSIASQGSGLKGVFKSTFSKISRKNSVREGLPQSPPPLPQQQTMMPISHDLVPSASTSTKRLSRLSTFKLGRKKSVTSLHFKEPTTTTAPAAAAAAAADVPKKRSFSIHMKNKIKSIVNKKSS